MNIEDLKKPIEYKWKVQTANASGCNCVAYIDSRDVQDCLDNVLGANNWQDKYYYVGNHLFCSIGIKINDEWVWKSDTGTESREEKEKGVVSDSFKRAAVKWGIGRFLYSLGIVRTNSIGYTGRDGKERFNVADGNGKKMYGNDSISEYVQKIYDYNHKGK